MSRKIKKPKAGTDAIVSHIEEGKLDDALAAANAVLANQPTDAKAWYLKGIIEKKKNTITSAVTCFNTALKHKPDYMEACEALAQILEETKQIRLAIKTYEYWLKLELSQPVANKSTALVSPKDRELGEEWFHKGEAFERKGDAENAAHAFRKVLEFQPDLPQALINLGMALDHMRFTQEARQTLLRALRLKPGSVAALNILAKNYAESGEHLKAIAAWRQVVTWSPHYVDAWMNMSKVLAIREYFEESIKTYEQAVRIDATSTKVVPDLFLHLLHHLCRWEKVKEVSAAMYDAIAVKGGYTDPFFATIHLVEPKVQLMNAKRYVEKHFPGAKPYDPKRPLPVSIRSDKRLRIGYMSADFNKHATAYLISEMFTLHDRSRFEIYAYSYGVDDNSEARARIRKAVDRFHDIGTLDEKSILTLADEDGIDIMVDLKGYTRGHELNFMAQRPAPIQIHYLGFPGTTGAPFIDYYIADPIVAPAGMDNYFSEALIRLPHTYQINDRMRPLPENILPRDAYGLPAEGFVFGAFNNNYKITPEMFSVWMRLLMNVEGSVLWLYERHGETSINLKSEAEKRGINPSRLIFAKHTILAEHIQRYAHVDLFLDTNPVCGHTTASDALWCGVPVVALAGESFVSRVAASLLHAVGLPELVTDNIKEYEALALSLARDPERLKSLRDYLVKGRMTFPLFDSAATTRAIEAAYIQVAERHMQGLAPHSFTVSKELQ